MRTSALNRRLAAVAAGLLVLGLLPGTAADAVVPAAPQAAKPQADRLNRGVVSVHTAAGNRVGWRLLADDPPGVAFNVYRDGTRVTGTPVSGPTSFLDTGAPAGARYTVRAVVGGAEVMSTFAAAKSLTLDSGVAAGTGTGGDTRLLTA
ncbi:hypothetical protein CF165_49015, partial [Amycolatopsis vastitatis]